VADTYDAIVLAGGSARRLGGVDKPGLVVGAGTLLDRVVAAVSAAARVVVVGPARTTSRPVIWTREEPPGGGPVAALAAGLVEVRAEHVVVLAGDLPFITDTAVAELLDAVAGDGALAVDADGRDQLLVGAWRTEALRRALPVQPAGAALFGVLASLDAVRVTLAARPDVPAPWFDCDTEEDLARARARGMT
jgi:molybdopterin-guanine dinucleotide biosynthesis protein A